MFLREKSRTKDGKTHRYWSVVENRRVSGGGVVQRQVLYLVSERKHLFWKNTKMVFHLPIDNFKIRGWVFAKNTVLLPVSLVFPFILALSGRTFLPADCFS